jgi:hypothetical protein
VQAWKASLMLRIRLSKKVKTKGFVNDPLLKEGGTAKP